MVLKGYGFTLAPARVAILVAVVMAGRLALSLLLQSHRGKAFIARFEGRMTGCTSGRRATARGCAG